MIKILKIISALTLVNLIAVILISNIPFKIDKNTTEIHQPAVQPTPIVVVRKVINKITRYATNAPGNSSIASQDTTNTAINTTTSSTSNNNPTQPIVTAPPAQPPAPSGCIISIDGTSYDVTSLRKSHSGGDIFNCGSDMSATFWGRHGQSILNKMQQYRI